MTIPQFDSYTFRNENPKNKNIADKIKPNTTLIQNTFHLSFI